MHLLHTHAIPYYVFTHLQADNYTKHFITTREGGVSPDAYATLNLGFNKQESESNMIETRQKVANAINNPIAHFCMPSQTHSKRVVNVYTKDRGKGVYPTTQAIPATDALITNVPQICLMVLSADCVPLLFYDPVQRVVAACHAGWRGTVQKIAQATLLQMQKDYHCHAENILVGIGPSISKAHYEVGEDVVQATEQAFGTREGYLEWHAEKQKYHLDLWYANQKQLLDVGVLATNIEIAAICTYEQSATFFSARKHQGITGRFGAGIMLL
ncbi:MAG: peptidoglycan editing factor PgeF [Thermonemataceae bacterium]